MTMAAGCRKLAAEPVPSADPLVPLPAMVDTTPAGADLYGWRGYNNRLHTHCQFVSTAAQTGLEKKVAVLAGHR